MTSLKQKILGIRMQSEAKEVVLAILRQEYSMEELMECFFADDWVLCQKASWPLTKIAEMNPESVQPYLSRMVENLNRPVHDAVIRNTIRAWQIMNLPVRLHGPIYDLCFQYLIDPEYAIAIRVFAMTVCSNIAVAHPALANEIITVIEDHWDHSTAAWRSRGKKELRRLRKVVES